MRHGCAAPPARRRNRTVRSGMRRETAATAASARPTPAYSAAAPPGSLPGFHCRRLSRRLPVSLSTEPPQRRFEIGEQQRERALQCRAPSDQHIIPPGSRRLGQQQPRRLAQAAAGPIASHGIAHLAAGGKTDADNGGQRHTVPIVSPPHLQYQPRARPGSPAMGDTQELRSVLQAGNGRCHGRFRRKGACAPACAEPPAHDVRRRSPSAHENRGGACE